mmetsp:Transcript_535/g.1611  ORF Transcript_535/g.1611 Transcript_535/m.1611 type:complete len:721 (+) Transcript_535:147-2309(+)
MSGNGQSPGQTTPRARIIKFKLPSLEKRKKKRSTYNSESLVRGVRFLRYCLVCSASLFRAMAPFGLAMTEAAVMLLMYFVAVPGALVVRRPLPGFRYAFARSLEDVVALSLLRAGAVTLAYWSGAGAKRHKPYMWTAYAFAAVGGPFAVVKLLAFDFPRHSAPAVLVLLSSLAFTGLHLAAAHNVVRWARRRADMGLDGFGYPWEEGEEAWFMLGRTGGISPPRDPEKGDGGSTGGGGGGEWVDDVTPQSLADPDSRFMECGAVTVHLKEALPPAGQGRQDTGVMLIHGYGSGVFAWRHVMQPLAQQCGCRVVAFDRPAFGLTSRPRPPSRGDSPYSLRSAARLAVLLAHQLGLKRVVFVGHADGALVALLATALAAHKSSPTALHAHAGWLENGTAAGAPPAGSSGSGRRLTESALKAPRPPPTGGGGGLFGSGPAGGWASLLPGPLAPLAERHDDAESNSSGSGVALLPLPGHGRQSGVQQTSHNGSHSSFETAPSVMLPESPAGSLPQDRHRDSGLPQQDTEAVAGPASALAPSASAASLKLRGLTPGTTAGLHSHSNSSSSYVSGQVGGPGRIAPAHSALLRTSSSDATASGSLTVMVVQAGGANALSDSATVTASDDFADDCGLYSPMLSPRRSAGGHHSRSCSSSAEDLTMELPSPLTSRISELFAPPPEQHASSPSPPADEWRGLLTDAGEGGGHYFDTTAAGPPPPGGGGGG